MSDDFIDTNIFVYLFDEVATVKRQTAQDLIQTALEAGAACISFQVIQETLNIVTRKLPTPATLEDAVRFTDQVLRPLWRVMPSRNLYHRGLEIQSRYGYSFYDALIISAALDAGCTRLYSEDLQHGQRIENLMIENPFRQ